MSFLKKGKSGAQKRKDKKIKERKANEGKQLLTQFFVKKESDSFSGWTITANGGDRWVVEGLFSPHPDDRVTKCFVTSYGQCMKKQIIDLEKEGYSPAFMDGIQPNIIISDWYVPRWDCGSLYEIRVELLDNRKKIIQCFQPKQVTFPQWNDQKWEWMTHTFKNYGPGVRFIHFEHGGKDTQYWAGHFGIRVTNSSVELVPSSEV